jgi:hypothetical protein
LKDRIVVASCTVLLAAVFAIADDGAPRYSAAHYGYWGGKYWSGGKNTEKISLMDFAVGKGMGTAAPVDSMDEAFKRHDQAYYAAEQAYVFAWDNAIKQFPRTGPDRDRLTRKAYSDMEASKAEADKELVSDLRALDDDPKKWASPPQDTKRATEFRKRAMSAFSFLCGVSGALPKP